MCRGYVLSVRVKTKKCVGHKNVINMLDAFVNTYVHHLVPLFLLSSFISGSAFFLLSLLSFIDLGFFCLFFIPYLNVFCFFMMSTVNSRQNRRDSQSNFSSFDEKKRSKTNRERENPGYRRTYWLKKENIDRSEREMVVKENRTSSVLSLAVVALTEGTIKDENRIRRPLFSLCQHPRSRKLKTWEMPDQTKLRSTQPRRHGREKENFLTMVHSSRNVLIRSRGILVARSSSAIKRTWFTSIVETHDVLLSVGSR